MLETLSGGKLKVETTTDDATRETLISMRFKSGTPFKGMRLKIDSNGKTRLGVLTYGDKSGYSPALYEAQNEEDIRNLLSVFTMETLLTGHLTVNPQQVEAKGPEQQAVLDAIRTVEEQRVMARMGANNLAEELKPLKEEFNERGLDFKIKESTKSPAVSLKISFGKATLLEIPVDRDGAATIGDKKYDLILDPGAMAEIKARIKDIALVQPRRNGNNGPA